MAVLLAACVLLPMFLGLPRVLDDSRLDGGVLALMVVATALVALLRKRPSVKGFGLSMPAGSGWLLFALALGGVGLFGLEWTWVVSGIADRMPLFAAWALMVLAYSAADELKTVWRWLFRGCAVVAGYNLLQLIGWDPLALAPAPGLPPTPPLAGRAHAGELLTVFVVAGAAWRSFTPNRKELGHWLLLFGPAAFMAGYYDLMAGRLAMVLGLAWLVLQQRHKLAPAALMLGLMAAGEATRVVSAPPFAVQDAGESGLPAWASVQGRSYLYQACLSKSVDTPMGIGFGRFERDYPRWRSQEEQRMSASNYENITSRRPKTPHNEPLLILVETGWLGFAAFAWGAWLLLRPKRRNGMSTRWTSPALAALGVHVLVRSPLSDNGPLLAFAAVLIAQHALVRRKETATLPPPLAWRWIPMQFQPQAWMFVCTVAILAAIPAPAQLFGELAVAKRIPLTETQPPEMLEAAVEWRPWDSRAWGLLSVDYSRVDQTPVRVEHALRQALLYDPTDLWALNSFFKLEMTRGHIDNALQLLAIAEMYSPSHPAIRTNRTIYINQLFDLHRNLGLNKMKNQQVGAHEDLRLAQLLQAMAKIREGEEASARKALNAAAFYSTEGRGKIERVARMEELSEQLVHTLLLDVQPDLAPHIGPGLQ